MTTPPRKADFSNVESSVKSTEHAQPTADFRNVRAEVGSTEQIVGDAGERTYTVAKGDSLSHIAQHFYGKASRWRAIFEANRDQLDDPDRITPGQVLKIPAAGD